MKMKNSLRNRLNMKDCLGLIILFLASLNALLYPYAILNEENKDAKIIFIAPWTSLVSDLVTPLNQSDKEVLFAKYSSSLKEYSNRNGYLYIDPNEYILNELKGIDSKYYLKDHIHPNKINGIKLYSEAVIASN